MLARAATSRLEPWFAPFALVNGSAVGLVPILLPLVAVRYGVGHVGLVMGAFNLGAFAAPLAGNLADRFHAYRLLTAICAGASAVSLWLFPLLGSWPQILLALANGAGFAGAVTVANLLIVERRPRAEWNQRLGWLETALSVGQGAALILAAWLSGLRASTALLAAAVVPAVAVPLALLLISREPRASAAAPASATHTRPATHTRTAAHALPAAHARPDADPVPAALPVPGADPVAGDHPAAFSEVTPAEPADGQAASVVSHHHHLASAGHVGEWGPASPSRAHHLHRHKPLAGASRLLTGRFGWMLAAWVPAYGGTAIVFALYPVLFRAAFGVSANTSALAFAAIVFVSLPLFVLAGRVCQRRGPALSMAGAFGARILLLVALTIMAAVGHVPAVLPLTAFAGIMFAWSFLSVASPGLTGQLAPDSEGDAQGLLNAASGLAGLAGAVVGGFAASRWGYPAALGIGAGAVTLGLAVFAITNLRGESRPSQAATPAQTSAD